MSSISPGGGVQRVTRMSCYKQLSANMIARRIKRSSLIFDVQDSRLTLPRYTKEAEHVENNVIILVKKIFSSVGKTNFGPQRCFHGRYEKSHVARIIKYGRWLVIYVT